MNNYGKIFLLLASIGIILVGTSGKGRELWLVATGKASVSDGVPKPTNPTDFSSVDKNSGKQGAGSGGVRA